VSKAPSPKRPGEILAEVSFRNWLAEALPTSTMQERRRISKAATERYVGLGVIEAAPQLEGVVVDFETALGAINEGSSARLSRALRGTAVEGRRTSADGPFSSL
jgi:hypothetical protein